MIEMLSFNDHSGVIEYLTENLVKIKLLGMVYNSNIGQYELFIINYKN